MLFNYVDRQIDGGPVPSNPISSESLSLDKTFAGTQCYLDRRSVITGQLIFSFFLSRAGSDKRSIGFFEDQRKSEVRRKDVFETRLNANDKEFLESRVKAA